MVVDDPPEREKRVPVETIKEKSPRRAPHSDVPSTDEAQRKFGSAKAISSAQYFGDGAADSEGQASLSRFQVRLSLILI